MERTFAQTEEIVRSALRSKIIPAGTEDAYVWVRDIADDWVVFMVEGVPGSDGMFRASYVIDDQAAVTIGDPQKVQAKIEYDAVEAATTREPGRVLEARGTNDAGGRVFHVRIIAAGDSKNGRRYPLSVLRDAAALYEGAKAFDHHRTDAELMSSTVEGLVGQYRNVEADTVGLVADLHLLPGATHVAEGLDASLAAQADGLPPIMGISHDSIATWKVAKVTESGRTRRLEEATKIVRVLSADVVADPAAGGVPLRSVAGGITPDGDGSNQPTVPEEETTMSLAEMLASATDEDKQALRDLLGTAATTETTEPGESTTTTDQPAEERPAEGELVGAGAARESMSVQLLVKHAVESAGLDAKHVATVTQDLPERVTEADVSRAVARIQRVVESFEKDGLRPGVTGNIRVTGEAADKTRERVYQTVCGNYREGFTSFFDMYEAVTGVRVRQDADHAAQIIRESWSPIGRNLSRATESIDSTSFAQVLGDSISRRLVAQYRAPAYSSWEKIVTKVPVRDFRTNRRTRLGGYGDLPTVEQGGAYQPLTSPSDEEATYALAKKGGTEDLTMESILNDDLGALARIPNELGRAAARTIHKFVWNTLFSANPTCTYDSVALFHASHSNTTAVALSNSGMNTLRRLMRDQPAYGVAGEPLGILPKFLIVPNELEDLANQLCTGARAVPATTPGATDVPNLHAGTEPIVVDHFTDADDWYMAADPADVPIIEIGFLNGREDPELFMQDDPKVGAVFSSDKVSWKIRHIYSGANVDHRGVQRGTQ